MQFSKVLVAALFAAISAAVAIPIGANTADLAARDTVEPETRGGQVYSSKSHLCRTKLQNTEKKTPFRRAG